MAMDTFYISHGLPTLSIDDSLPARHFLKSWEPDGLAGPQPPCAILIVSGHWETDIPAVNVIRGTNDTIYDFYGFPEQMYKLMYPAPGAPDVALRTKKLLEGAGFGPVSEDHGRGLDHGAWVLLMLMYPEANIPVCQLSVQTDRDGTYHYDLGRALAPLRDDGVLIVGSGSATHNLRRILRTFAPTSGEPVPEWAAEFDAWLRESLLNGRHDDQGEAVQGDGAVRQGGASTAGPLLPAARRSRRGRAGGQSGAHPPQLVQHHALLRVLPLHHQQDTLTAPPCDCATPPLVCD